MKKQLITLLILLSSYISYGQQVNSFCSVEIWKYNEYTGKFYLSNTTTSYGHMFTNDDVIKIYVDGKLYFDFNKVDLEIYSEKVIEGVSIVTLRSKVDKTIFIQANQYWLSITKGTDYKIIFNTCK